MFFWGGMLTAQIPEKPSIQKGVYDRAGLLTAQESSRLNQTIINYSNSTSTQIVVLTLPNLNGNEIAMYATEIAHQWGIGTAKKDNGILLLIAKKERQMYIATGYGVEHLLTDVLAKELIETVLKPNFKRGDFYNGIQTAIEAIKQILKGTYTAKKRPQKKSGSSIFLLIALVVFLFVYLRNRNKGGKNGGGRRGLDSSDVLTMLMLGSMGSRRGHSSSFGGGGFSSGGFSGGFGGGGFGGGGAGGSW